MLFRSGLSAAHFFRARTSRASRILVLDNHDDFGGHARRNEFQLDGRLHLLEEFPTAGGTDAATFRADGALYLAVSNSLTPDVRFRTDTVIYRFNG